MLTLAEAVKRNPGETHRDALVEIFRKTSGVLDLIAFKDIEGNAYEFPREATLPTVAYRAVNTGYTESTGTLDRPRISLKISGGDLDVDTFLERTVPGARAAHEMMKAKALARLWELKFIKGDESTDPEQPDGLQEQVAGAQIIANHATAAPLSLSKLDEAIDAVDSPTAILCNKAIRRRITAAARSSTVGGQVDFTQDSFGRRQTVYNDIPIVVIDPDSHNTAILDFSEANSTTSLYIVSFGDDETENIYGIQNGMMDVRDLGEVDTAPRFRTRVEWFSNFVIPKPRAAARLSAVTNAAATV